MDLTGKTINVLGDSITEGFGTSRPGNRFTDVMAREYRCRVNNYGIGGSRIARQHVITEAPADRDFCMRLDDMDESADAVVVFGGTNDYGHGEAPLGVFSDRTPETFYGACHYLMDQLLTRYPGKPVLICTPLRRMNEDNPTGDGPDWKKFPVAPLITYRNILKEVAFYWSLPVLDLYAESGIQPLNAASMRALLPDGLHPSDLGHAMLARRIGEKLKTL